MILTSVLVIWKIGLHYKNSHKTENNISSESNETENKIKKENQYKHKHFCETFNETEEPLTWLLMKRGKS